MLRKTLTIFSLVGLLLSVGLWLVSLRLHILYGWNISDKRMNVIGVEWGGITYAGGVLNTAPVRYFSFNEDGELETDYLVAEPIDGWIEGHRYRERFWHVPLWPIAASFALLFWLSYLRGYHRRKRKKLGLCINCGYSLHGLPEPRCPECDTEFHRHPERSEGSG